MKITRILLFLLLLFLLSLLLGSGMAAIVDDGTVCPNNPNVTWSGHDWQYEESLPATCQHALREVHRCSFCGKTYSSEYGALGGHSYGSPKTTNPTCTEPGSACAVCGEVLAAQQDIPATGHTWSKSEITKQPACTEEGELTWYCYNDPAASIGDDTEALTITLELLQDGLLRMTISTGVAVYLAPGEPAEA